MDMREKCPHCLSFYLEGAKVCGQCGRRLRPVPEQKKDTVKDPEQAAGKPGVHISRGNVGVSERKMSVEGVSAVSDKSGNIGYDNDRITIRADAAPDNFENTRDRKPGFAGKSVSGVPDDTGIEADLANRLQGIHISRGNVGYDDSTINIVFNNYNMIDPAYHAAVRPWENLKDPATAYRRTKSVYVATRKSVLEFTPDENGERLLNASTYSFKEPVSCVRSLTPLDIAGEIVLLVGTKERVGIWQPLHGNRSEMGFFRCMEDGIVSRGFNSATAVDGCIYATHGEKGLIRWHMADPDAFTRLNLTNPAGQTLASGKSLRALRAMPDKTFFVIRDRSVLNLVNNGAMQIVAEYTCPDVQIRRCLFMDPGSKNYRDCRCPENRCPGNKISRLTGYVILDHDLFAVSENGLLIHWDRRDTSSGRVIRNFGTFCFTIESTRVFNETYMVIGCGFGVHLVPVRTGAPEWFYPYIRGQVNTATAGDDLVVASADDLSALVVWNTQKPGEAPVQVIPLKVQFGHRVQSVCVIRE
jgi:hypothetical protein